MKAIRKFFDDSNIYGKLMLLIGALILFPILVVPFYPGEVKYIPAFALTALGSFVLGLLVCCIRRKKTAANFWQSPMQQGSVPVLFAWLFGILAGAVPFMISGFLTPVRALFESTSGWTTTGLVVSDVAHLPQIFLFHRSFMQYCGGLGFIMMILLIMGGKQAANLFNAEGHPDRLMPNIKKTTQTIFLIYNGFLILGTVLYVIFGMPVFDAICHTMSALSTAGFSPQVDSIGAYGSYPIEVVTIFLMLIGGTNFSVLLLLARLQLKKLFRVSEVRFMLLMMAVLTPLTAISLTQAMGINFWKSLHRALFGIVTTFTTTGYAIEDYTLWPPFAMGVIVILMVIGGGIGSTAGGIKLSRTNLLFRIMGNLTRKRLKSSRNVTAEYYYRAQGKTPIDESVIMEVFHLTIVYLMVMVVGSLLITFTEGCGLFEAMFEFTSALGTIGLSIGVTYTATDATLIVEIIGMILGRLEIFIVFVAIFTLITNAMHAVSAKREERKNEGK